MNRGFISKQKLKVSPNSDQHGQYHRRETFSGWKALEHEEYRRGWQEGEVGASESLESHVGFGPGPREIDSCRSHMASLHPEFQ